MSIPHVASDSFSRTVAYSQLQDTLVDVNTSPKLVKILVAEEIYRPDEGVHQTPGGHFIREIDYLLRHRRIYDFSIDF